MAIIITFWITAIRIKILNAKLSPIHALHQTIMLYPKYCTIQKKV